MSELAGEVAHLRFRAERLVQQVQQETAKSREYCREFKRLRREARRQMVVARIHQHQALSVCHRVAALRDELVRLTKQIDHFGVTDQDSEIAASLRAVAAMIESYAG